MLSIEPPACYLLTVGIASRPSDVSFTMIIAMPFLQRLYAATDKSPEPREMAAWDMERLRLEELSISEFELGADLWGVKTFLSGGDHWASLVGAAWPTRSSRDAGNEVAAANLADLLAEHQSETRFPECLMSVIRVGEPLEFAMVGECVEDHRNGHYRQDVDQRPFAGAVEQREDNRDGDQFDKRDPHFPPWDLPNRRNAEPAVDKGHSLGCCKQDGLFDVGDSFSHSLHVP